MLREARFQPTRLSQASCSAGLVCSYFSQGRVEVLAHNGTLPLRERSPNNGGVTGSPVSLCLCIPLSLSSTSQCPLFVPGSVISSGGSWLFSPWAWGAPRPRLPVFIPDPVWLSCLVWGKEGLTRDMFCIPDGAGSWVPALQSL